MTPWEGRISTKVAELWRRILEQAKASGITVPPKYRQAVPKEFTKFGYFEPLVDMLIAHEPSKVMGKQRTVVEYIDIVLAKKLKWKKVHKAADREKQMGMFSIVKHPSFTPVAKNFTLEMQVGELKRLVQHSRNQPDWEGSALRDEVAGEVTKFGVHGYVNPLFIMGHASVVAGTMNMPWTAKDPSTGKIQHLPLPDRDYAYAWPQARDEMISKGFYLTPSHMLVGSRSAGGSFANGEGCLQIGNSAGAAGFPYTGEKDARALTSDGDRASKGNTAKREIAALVDWVRADQPWSGPLYERIAQPCTMTSRGDAKVDIDLAIFATALLEAGYPLAHMLMPGRGIVIVPGVATLMEGIVGGPFLEMLNIFDVGKYDLREGRILKSRILKLFELLQMGYDVVSGDTERWDLNAYPGEHGYMAAAWANLLPPGKHPLLFGAASGPALWSAKQIQELRSKIPVGGSEKIQVEVPNKNKEGSHLEWATVHNLEVDLRKFVVQAFQIVHGSGVRVAGYALPTEVSRARVPDEVLTYGDSSPSENNWYINVHGGIRSGSLLTSANNSMLNDVINKAAPGALKRLGVKSKLVQHRAKAVGLGRVTRIEGDHRDDENTARGDDFLNATRMKIYVDNKVLTGAESFSFKMSMAGRFANASKQVEGTKEDPLIEFASVSYGLKAKGGNTPVQRSFERTVTTEGSSGAGGRTPWDISEVDLDLGLIEDTLSAKARLAPQRGSGRPTSPFGSPTPGNREFIRSIAAMDIHGLVYDLESLDPSAIQARIDAEARRYAMQQSLKRGGTVKNYERYEQEWKEAEIHTMLSQFARERGKTQHKARTHDGARKSFLDAVSEARKGGNPYLFQ